MLSAYRRSPFKPPWGYNVTVVIPHYYAVEFLEASLACLRRQTIPVYYLILDIGSPDHCRERLERSRADDCEIHYLCPHTSRHTSWYIAAALDVGLSLCHTERVYLTHVDVFHRDNQWIAYLGSLCSARHPVVGYEISQREALGGEGRGMVGHTSTMLYLPTIRELGVQFGMDQAVRRANGSYGGDMAYQDTEVGFNRMLRFMHVPVLTVGHEAGPDWHEDETFVHARSLTSRIHDGRAVRDQDYLARVNGVVAAALAGTL